tara:strand:+ start:205 stop:687 length:483 start_codon:yes stop_codon:yes gene_type:complete
MPTYQSRKIKNNVPATTQPYNLIPATFEVTVTAALSAADVIDCVTVPKYAKVVDFYIDVTDLDTNGSPTITLDVGDDLDDNRFCADSVAGQAGGQITPADGTFVDASLPFHNVDTDAGDNSTDRTFRLTVGTGAATGVAGTVKGVVYYTMEDGYQEVPAA